MSTPEIRHATVDEILPLRSEVLRGGGPLERALLPGDREGLGVHWGAWVDGRLAACGSLYEVTDEDGHRSTQLRGMATAPDLRNTGIGGALLEAAIAEWEASPNRVGPLWCNARIRAVPFYTRHRFNGIGEPFDFPGVGEHLKMIYIKGACMIGALFGVLAAFAWGGGDFVGGIISRRLPTFFVVAASQAVALLILIPVAALSGQAIPESDTALTTALAGVTGGTGVLALYHGFAHGRISIVASIAGSLAALIPVAVAAAGGEALSTLRIVGFFFAIIAIIIVSTSADTSAAHAGEPGAHKDASSGAAPLGGAIYGLLAGVCFAGFSLIFSGIESSGTLWLLTGLRVASVSALVAVFLISRLIGKQPPGAEPIRTGVIPTNLRGRLALFGTLAAAGSGDTLGNLFFLLSAQESGVAVAAVFTSIAPVTTVLFAALILRERIGRRQAVGIGLAGVATVAIALGGLS